MPVWSMGAVTMNMISSTSMTSTSGVTLISERKWLFSLIRCEGHSAETPFHEIQKFRGEVVHLSSDVFILLTN